MRWLILSPTNNLGVKNPGIQTTYETEDEIRKMKINDFIKLCCSTAGKGCPPYLITVLSYILRSLIFNWIFLRIGSVAELIHKNRIDSHRYTIRQEPIKCVRRNNEAVFL